MTDPAQLQLACLDAENKRLRALLLRAGGLLQYVAILGDNEKPSKAVKRQAGEIFNLIHQPPKG